MTIEKQPEKGILSALREWGVLIALVSPVVAFFSIISMWGTIPSSVQKHEERITENEGVIHDQTTQLAVMQNDISYIKEKVKKL